MPDVSPLAAVTSVLTKRMEAFCGHYVETRSQAMAYRLAYDANEDRSDKWCAARARDLFGNPAVAVRVDELMINAATSAVFTKREALARFLQIAFADPNELISLKIGCCRYCYGENHEYEWTPAEYTRALQAAEDRSRAGEADVRLPLMLGGNSFDRTRPPCDDCPECNGEGVPRTVMKDTEHLTPGARMLYGGVKETAQGVQIIIADKGKALENAARIIGAFDDKVTVNGAIKHMVASVALEAKDPREAARIYQEMIGGMSAT